MRYLTILIFALSAFAALSMLTPTPALSLDCTTAEPYQAAAAAAIQKAEATNGISSADLLTRLKLLANSDDAETSATAAEDAECLGERINTLKLRAWTNAEVAQNLPQLMHYAPPKSADCQRVAELSRDADLAQDYMVFGLTAGSNEPLPINREAFAAVSKIGNDVGLNLPPFTSSLDKAYGEAIAKTTATKYQTFKATMTESCAFSSPNIPLFAVVIFFPK